MTFLALWTGALWGRPTWGAYWVWDARLTSTRSCCSSTSASWRCRRRSTTDAAPIAPARCSPSSASINVPIIYFSVKWWNTLHQGASVRLERRVDGHADADRMLVMAFAFWIYAIAVS